MSVVKLDTMLETAGTKEDALEVGHVPGLQDGGGHTHHQGLAQEIGLVPKIDHALETDLALGLAPDQPVEIAVVHMTEDLAHALFLEIGTALLPDLSQKIEIRIAIVLPTYVRLKFHVFDVLPILSIYIISFKLWI